MKVKAYMRVAKGANGKPKVAATVKPARTPLADGSGNHLMTVAFAIELDIPESLFRRGEQVVATLHLAEDATNVQIIQATL